MASLEGALLAVSAVGSSCTTGISAHLRIPIDFALPLQTKERPAAQLSTQQSIAA